MRCQPIVRTRFPRAFAIIRDDVWVVLRGDGNPMPLGIGATAAKAWRNVITNLGFAEGFKKWHESRLAEIFDAKA